MTRRGVSSLRHMPPSKLMTGRLILASTQLVRNASGLERNSQSSRYGGSMRRLLRKVIPALVVLASAPALLAAKNDDRIHQIASILSGTFEGSTPGNQLRLDLSTITVDPNHPYD